ncbi:hypothetical protein [Staphylococcus pseudintermedius]|uniref:hypothetical protein n=2 Tax=Staphylococcus pseudintermedius TaxID=283734 RepID=UPI001932150A|nr:hypothetical protein [Staphylococcus pseudintermedius]EGQ4115325.1 hypothetical protein [Staphylococcus pseudintermedius]EJG5121625.1 hypothetical protein [Staphylococcus pseudintermedius]MBM0384908.1 hypothetical protein [Staphylococcus pseudintermedius]MCE5540919.1 hypothetical protein [Staphylococcus pseudintermedius]MDE9873643.1 hypothetical protein [Staphylococcus pseudintermedius]
MNYRAVALSDATCSILKDIDAVTLLFEDENQRKFCLDSVSKETANNVINFSNNESHFIFIKDDVEKSSNLIDIEDVLFLKEFPLISEQEEIKVSKPLISKKSFGTDESKIVKNYIDKYVISDSIEESLTFEDMMSVLQKERFNIDSFKTLLSLTILIGRLKKELDSTISHNSLKLIVATKDKFLATLEEMFEFEDKQANIHSQFLYDVDLDSIKAISDDDFNQFNKVCMLE